MTTQEFLAIDLNYLLGLQVRTVFEHTVSFLRRIQVPCMTFMNYNEKEFNTSLFGNPLLGLCIVNSKGCADPSSLVFLVMCC